MTINHSLTMAASHIVRIYLWDKLTEHMPDTWSLSAGQNFSDMPIIPAQEQPEEQTSEKPYIVYIYDYMATSDLWQYQRESMSLRIFSQSPATIAATTKLCVRLFNKHDETAMDINEWLHSDDGLAKFAFGDSRYDQWIDEAKNFSFRTVTLSGTQGVQPAVGEGGRLDAIITIEIRYIEREMGLDNNN